MENFQDAESNEERSESDYPSGRFYSTIYAYMQWKTYLLSNGHFDAKPLFYQHVTIELFEQLLHEKLEEFNTEQPLSDINISEEEENAIRYMAGYVIHKLEKKTT